MVDWFDFGLREGEDHFTSITIKDLRDGIATKLANPAERQAWAQQVLLTAIYGHVTADCAVDWFVYCGTPRTVMLQRSRQYHGCTAQ